MLKLKFIFLFIFISLCQAAYANILISVNPVDGSNTLHFERTPIAGDGNNKEIHIHVSSSNGARYQVFQRILEPMIDEKGNSLNLQAIETATVANTNAYGNLYLQNSAPMSLSDQ